MCVQGFSGRAATTTIHDATATGVSISGIFQAAEDFAVLRLWNAYDYFTHELRMPSAKDVFEYRRGFARVLDLPYNRQELVIYLAPAATLFKKLIQSSEGYAGDVPIIHQAVAVKAAINALDAVFQETGDPN